MEEDTEKSTSVRQICACCEIEIDGPPVIRDGQTYCCEGCAAGGPCTCDYTSQETAPAAVPSPATGRRQVADVLKECVTLLEVWEQQADTSPRGAVDDVLARASYALRDAAKSLAGTGAAPAPLPSADGPDSRPATVNVAKRAPGEELRQVVERVTGRPGGDDDTLIVIDDDAPAGGREVAGYELGVDVFLNARHHVPGERHGETHPHSWRIQARLTGNPEQSRGTLAGSAEVRELIEKCLTPYHDKLLNQTPPFDAVPPTSENLAAAFYRQVDEALTMPGLKLDALCLWDSPTSYVTYREAA